MPVPERKQRFGSMKTQIGICVDQLFPACSVQRQDCGIRSKYRSSAVVILVFPPNFAYRFSSVLRYIRSKKLSWVPSACSSLSRMS